jgi:hypothetical protein
MGFENNLTSEQRNTSVWRIRLIQCVVFAAGVFLLSILFRIPDAAGWDEAFYMSQMTSGIFDRDLMLQNDLLSFPNHIEERIRTATTLRTDGVHVHAFSMGPSVFFSMVMMPVYVFDSERFGLGFQRGTALWTLFFLVLVIIFLDRLLKEFDFRTPCRYAAIVATIFSTPFLRYGFREYLSSHFLAAVLTIFCLLFAIKWLKYPCYTFAWAAGLASGWLMITRWQTLVFMLCLLPPVIITLFESDHRKQRVYGLGIAVLSALPFIGIQCAAWKIHYGEWVFRPVEEGFVNWLNPEIIPFVVSGYHGLLPWAPGLVIGWLGLVVMGFAHKNRINQWLIRGFALGMLIQVYVNASVWDWWGGSSYGPRRMTFLLGPAAVGLAYILQKSRWYWGVVLVVGAVAWGIFTSAAYYEEVDDLTLLFTGEPDAMRPARCPVNPDIEAERWQRWKNGFEQMLMRNFSLMPSPRRIHCRWGKVILACVTGLALFACWLISKRKSAQYAVLTILTVYCTGVLCAMIVLFPSNMPWHQHWEAVVLNRSAELPDKPPPKGYMQAVRLVRTWNVLKIHSDISVLPPEDIYFEGFPGITLQTLHESRNNW